MMAEKVSPLVYQVFVNPDGWADDTQLINECDFKEFSYSESGKQVEARWKLFRNFDTKLAKIPCTFMPPKVYLAGQ